MISLIIISALSSAIIYLAYRVWYLAGVIADSQDLDSSNIEYIEGLELTNQYMYDKIVARARSIGCF